MVITFHTVLLFRILHTGGHNLLHRASFFKIPRV
jgi:hypothetical protein